MIKQNDPRLNKKIQLYGCNFLCHLAISRINWQPNEVEDVYKQAIKAKVIDENCTVTKVQELLELIGSPIRQIGSATFNNQGVVMDRWASQWGDGKIQYLIVCWNQRRSTYNHFTLHSLKGEIYDPFDTQLANYSLFKHATIREQYYG